VQFLIDKSPKDVERKMGLHPSLVAGQLLTPLTRYRNAKKKYAIDNGAYSGFDHAAFLSLLAREEENKELCLFVTVPDIVGSARRTLEIWRFRNRIIRHWPLALVMQDGMEDMEIPWDELTAVFIGGCDPWKDSKSAIDIVKTAKTLQKHAHVGRVNTLKRYKLFADAGADTCDGSGVAMYDHMLDDIARGLNKKPEPSLFDDKELEIDCEAHV
jgi:hypothetical protein